MNPNVFTGNSDDARIGREWLISLLEQSPVEVVFTKKDGTERTMKCTLMEKFLPETVGSDRPRNDETLAVYDLEKEGWRSFRWDSVKQVNFSLGSENA
jgi:hypothetical protein